MGCFYSSLRFGATKPLFTPEEISNLTETWNILKKHGISKFADEVLIRTINQNASLRYFWTSKMIVDANNFDFSQGESCIRTELSWHIGLREHSNDLVLAFEKLLPSINDEQMFSNEIHSLHLLRNISTLESDSLLLLKKSIIDIMHERFHMFEYSFTDDCQQAWNKFLTSIITCLSESDSKTPRSVNRAVSPVIIKTQYSNSI